MRDPYVYGPYGSYQSNHRNDNRYETDTPSEHIPVLRRCLYLSVITVIFVFYFLGYHRQLMFRDTYYLHMEMVMDRDHGSTPTTKIGKIGRWARNNLAFPVVKALYSEVTITFQHFIVKGAVSKVKNGKFTFHEMHKMTDLTDPEDISIVERLLLVLRLHGNFICIILLGIAWICSVLRFIREQTVRNVAKTVSVLCLIGVLAIKLWTAYYRWTAERSVLWKRHMGAAKFVTTKGALCYLDIAVVFLCFALLTMTVFSLVPKCMQMCGPQTRPIDPSDAEDERSTDEESQIGWN